MKRENILKKYKDFFGLTEEEEIPEENLVTIDFVESCFKSHIPLQNARAYTIVDLLRFNKFANDNPDLRGAELLKAYNKEFPELSAKEKLNNISNALGMSLPELLGNEG